MQMFSTIRLEEISWVTNLADITNSYNTFHKFLSVFLNQLRSSPLLPK